MLILVLVLGMTNGAWSADNCPAYPAFDSFSQSGKSQSLYNGTFSMAYTSAPVTPCHSVTYVTDANNVTTGKIESPGCCIQSSNYVFTPTVVTYDIGPVPGYTPSCPSLINETGSMKLLGTTGSGNSLCLMLAVCQPDYYGINVACKGSKPTLLSLQIVLLNLLGDLGLSQISNLQSVPQTDQCGSNNCPAA